MVGAAFAFIGEMFAGSEQHEKTDEMAAMFKTRLFECLEQKDNGRLEMTIAIPDESVLDNMARSLAKMVGARL